MLQKIVFNMMHALKYTPKFNNITSHVVRV